MKDRRLKVCPKCDIFTKLKIERRGEKSFMVCPKCGFEQGFKERKRPTKWFEKGVDF